MNKEIFGVKVNLVKVAIAVAIYDIIQILILFYSKYEMFQFFNRHDMGCHLDGWAPHCIEIYWDIFESILNFILCLMLICGSEMVRIIFC